MLKKTLGTDSNQSETKLENGKAEGQIVELDQWNQTKSGSRARLTSLDVSKLEDAMLTNWETCHLT